MHSTCDTSSLVSSGGVWSVSGGDGRGARAGSRAAASATALAASASHGAAVFYNICFWHTACRCMNEDASDLRDSSWLFQDATNISSEAFKSASDSNVPLGLKAQVRRETRVVVS